MKKNIKQQLLNSLEKDIEALQKIKEQTELIPINLISQMFPQGRWYKNWSDIVAEIILAFPMGRSIWTRHSISLCKKLKKPFYIIEVT